MTLEALIREKIAASGPITIAEYMALCLSHPQYGYYMHQDPLGADGDFTTAPEISQVFGELIGLWLAEQWRLMEKPECILAELGPGRGTLMADILRATKRISGFHEAISLHLVETSPALKQKQWKALAGKHPRIEWHESFDDLPPRPLLLVANEFFDALPIRQFVHEEDGWKERMVGVKDGRLSFTVIPAEAGIHATLDPGLRRDDAFYERCETSESVARAIGAHVKTQGGAALVIDYGYSGSPLFSPRTRGELEGGKTGDTLQAVKNHRYHDVLAAPGEADLTAHVDFDAIARAARAAGASAHGPVAQGAFLGRLGAIPRAVRLCEGIPDDKQAVVMSGVSRLLSPDQMGDLFKVLCIAHPDHPKPEGF